MIPRIRIGAAAVAGLGFGWHQLVGCATGACPLTSNAVVSTLYGITVGAVIAGSFH